MQAELEAILADVAALRAEVVGSVRLGMIATTARWLVPLLLDKLAAAHPGVRLVTTEATSSALGVLLAAGGLDCAVVNLPLSTPELKLRPLFDEDIVLLISKDHPLAIADAAPHKGPGRRGADHAGSPHRFPSGTRRGRSPGRGDAVLQGRY